MLLHESKRCIYCDRFLYNVDFELPFEVLSTGAFVMKMQLDINCGHCHRSHVYTIEPTETFRVDK